MENIETQDIQGIILKGYSKLPSAAYVLLRIQQAAKAKEWLESLATRITTGNTNPADYAINLSITYKGMIALGLPQHVLHQFPMELEDGMTTPHKQHFLGDFGTSDCSSWEWGNDANPELHFVLMLYASDESTLDALYEGEKTQFIDQGIVEIKKNDSCSLQGNKEHFGFRDGIAQPTIAGLKRKDSPGNTVAIGEFVLGYKNEYNQYTRRPILKPSEVNANLLPLSLEDAENFDLGKNGSFMVYRQMTQDVHGFWKYMDAATRTNGGNKDPQKMIRLASKMMGRWPNGASLVLSPDHDDPKLSENDKFGYREQDEQGLKCPFASHVRRTNPRDDTGDTRSLATQTSKKHRILRRGRAYGPPMSESMDPESLMNSNPDGKSRGLHFICFNGNINRQFEFIQNVWVNNPKFDNLYNERDPITGNHSNPKEATKSGTFTAPTDGLKERYTEIPEFTSVIGGAYLFMPGVRALSYFSKL